MKPFGGKYFEHQKRIFNYRLSRARRVSENTFGISTARWRIFERPINAYPERRVNITKAVVALHNFLMLNETSLPRHERRYCLPGFIDSEDKGGWRSEVEKDTRHHPVQNRKGANAVKKSAKEVRESFKSFFNSPMGAVPWQNEYVNK